MSDYLGFDCLVDNFDGTFTPVAGVTVKVRDVTHAANLADLTADSGGHVAAGTYAVAAGTLLRFRVENSDGLAGCAEQVTT